MKRIDEQSAIEFDCFPPVGVEDWSYSFATARARVLESMLLKRSQLVDMINASSFDEAIELLSGTDYALSGDNVSMVAVETMLNSVRSETRDTFADLIKDDEYIEFLRAREDFANMRLAIRRVVTEKAIGSDYSNEGTVPAADFEEIFEQEAYYRFPMYLQEGVEQAILGYYAERDISKIDHGIDKAQFSYKLKKARRIGSEFLLSLFRTQIDLTNIRTMLRLKMAEREDRDLFIEGGFVEIEKLIRGLNLGYDTLAGLFYSTAYDQIIEEGVSYLMANESFLGLEKLCEEHLMNFLQSTGTITAGPQPVIAVLLLKECEIRTVRMILSCKNNGLDSKLISDRLAEY
jgi:V/A-type H+-transporting ATPase subunit C